MTQATQSGLRALYIKTFQKQPMMRPLFPFIWHPARSFWFDCIWRLSRCHPVAIAKPENMRVHGDDSLSKGFSQNKTSAVLRPTPGKVAGLTRSAVNSPLVARFSPT
tara:strand:+ start:602 stop:922 length:321 start_codon:yes stop_codon:yes gene_type:complete